MKKKIFNRMKNLVVAVPFLLLLGSCAPKGSKSVAANVQAHRNFGDDRAFLGKNTGVVELASGEAKVLIAPGYQGRVMTSTCNGDTGLSFGWINYDLISKHQYQPHINAYGGEERLWMGPEGGQFSLFFKKGDAFDISHWQTPAIMDTVTYDLVSKNSRSALLTKSFGLANYSGTKFSVRIQREIELLDKLQAERLLGVSLAGVRWIGYQTSNTLTNIGNTDWSKSSGIMSLWLLSMLKADPGTTMIIPYIPGGAAKVNDSYFGKITSDRLAKRDSFLTFKADGHSRGKIGIPPSILKPVAGSFDRKNNVLTIMQFDYNGEKEYVNSMWKMQPDPFNGDALNAYNDGPNETGSQLGAFYELETSSPAVALKTGQSLKHVKRIYHFSGDFLSLDKIAQKLLGTGLDRI